MILSTIYAPKESVNDNTLSLLSVYAKTGDYVKKNDLLAEFETSKALMEVRADVEGFISVYVEPNTEIKVGEKMFELQDEKIAVKVPDAPLSVAVSAQVNQQTGSRTKFSKAARDYMLKNNLDFDRFKGFEFVTTKDIIPPAAADPAKNNSKQETVREYNATEKRVKPITTSKRLEFEYLSSVNSSSVVSRLSVFVSVEYRENIGAVQDVIKTTPLPTVIHEVSRLLLKYPNLNSFFVNYNQAFYSQVNVGFALDDGERGLKVASILDADKCTLPEIEDAIAQLAVNYANNKLTVKELTSATFTVTDLFNTDVYSFQPLVNCNNACILGISGFHNGGFIMDISFDHRLSSGKEVSQFLADLKFRLEKRFGIEASKKTACNITCVKCNRSTSEDLDGQIFFQKVINSKYNGFICSHCLNGW